MPDWLKDFFPYVLPVLGAAALAVIGRTVLSVRRLRRDLLDDVAIVQGLTGRGEALTRRSMNERAVRIVALERYPTFVAGDLIRLAIVFSLAGVSIYQTIIYAKNPPEDLYFVEDGAPLLLYVGFAGLNWYLFQAGWVWRLKDRNSVLEDAEVERDLDHADFLEMAGELTSAVLGALLTVGVPVALGISTLGGIDESKEGSAWILLAGCAALTIAIFLFLRASDTRPLSRLAAREAGRQRYANADARRAERKALRRGDQSETGDGSSSSNDSGAES